MLFPVRMNGQLVEVLFSIHGLELGWNYTNERTQPCHQPISGGSGLPLTPPTLCTCRILTGKIRINFELHLLDIAQPIVATSKLCALFPAASH